MAEGLNGFQILPVSTGEANDDDSGDDRYDDSDTDVEDPIVSSFVRTAGGTSAIVCFVASSHWRQDHVNNMDNAV